MKNLVMLQFDNDQKHRLLKWLEFYNKNKLKLLIDKVTVHI